jgi:tartrate dehydrogenase/decarboxylase/D-malate dehydrogenase
MVTELVTYRISFIPGDGIGPEVMVEGRRVLDAASDMEGFEIEWRDHPYGADHYLKTGVLMGEEDLKEVGDADAIYFGAIGDPRVEPGILERGILLAMRFYFDQYLNLRPVKLFEGVWTPLKDKGPEDIDMTFVRENTEDFYVGIGGRAGRGRSVETIEMERSLYNIKFGLDVETDADEVAYQIGVISRGGAERVIRYAFEYAKRKGRSRVTSVDKANVLIHAYGLWRRVFREVSEDYPGIETEFNYVDAAAMWMVKNPEHYQTVVTPNLFGDILTDLGAVIQGGMGLASGGNINLNGVSMFEPIHGSAPKYKGKNVADPIAAIWAGALLLDELGEERASARVMDSIRGVLREGRVRTYDLGGSSSTREVGEEIARWVRELEA